MAQRMGRPTGRSGAYNRRNTRDMAYIGGTAAPKLEPEYRPERKAPVRRKKTGLHQNQQLRRNRERAMAMDLPYVFLLAAACICTLYICVSYLHLQSGITARMHNIEHLEAQLEKMKTENDALETSINSSIDLNKIYEIATTELGMVYARRDQVLLYDKTESEYVRQYEDIPEH